MHVVVGLNLSPHPKRGYISGSDPRFTWDYEQASNPAAKVKLGCAWCKIFLWLKNMSIWKKTDEWNSFNKNIELTQFFNRGLNFKGCNFKATKIPTQTSRKLIRTNDQTVCLRWAMLWFKIHMVYDGVQHTRLVSKRNLFGNSWDDFPRTKINELRCIIPCCDISAVVFWCFC